jgi:hypothetical protein
MKSVGVRGHWSHFQEALQGDAPLEIGSLFGQERPSATAMKFYIIHDKLKNPTRALVGFGRASARYLEEITNFPAWILGF